MDDYTPDPYVEVISSVGDMSYEKILTESSLMVTDYSGVQFDFAYMRKCLIYYHPDQLPPHYDEGGLIYSTMGFGPICTNHEQSAPKTYSPSPKTPIERPTSTGVKFSSSISQRGMAGNRIYTEMVINSDAVAIIQNSLCHSLICIGVF